MALIALIAEKAPGSALELAKLLSFTIIPVFIVGPIAGVYVDRWDRRTTLFACDFLRGMLVTLIPLIFILRDSMVPIYIIVFLVFCLSRFYVPAKLSFVPDLVDNEHLLAANSLLTTSGMIAFVIGCALGGFLVDKIGARGGFIIDAWTFFLSGMLVFSIVRPLKFDRQKILATGEEMLGVIKKSLWDEFKEGLVYLKNHKEIRFIINMLFTLFAAAGAIYVVIIVFIQQTFQSVTKDLGILAVLLGVGLFFGVILYGKWGKRFAWDKTIFFCLTFGGIALSFFAWITYNYPSLAFAGMLSVLIGMISGPIFIAANTMTQQVCEQSMRGKVFSALEIVIHFAFLIAMFISSVLSEHVERVWILAVVGGLIMLVGLAGFVRSKKPLSGV